MQATVQIVDFNGTFLEGAKRQVSFGINPTRGDTVSIDIDVAEKSATRLRQLTPGVSVEGITVTVKCKVSDVSHFVYMDGGEDWTESLIILEPVSASGNQALLFIYDRKRCTEKTLMTP